VSGFTVIPAVDIAGGRCVRLRRGDPGAATVYYDDPVEAASRWAAEGATALHVVDLDAALGRGSNRDVVARVVASVDAPVQVAGGVRDVAGFESALSAGAARVVLGTAAVNQPELVHTLTKAYPGCVVVAADVRGENVVVEGWTTAAETSLWELIPRFSHSDVHLLITDISRDGVLLGPAVELYEEVARRTSSPVIASGGVRDVADVAALVRAGAAAVVIGTALYEGRIDLRAAQEAAVAAERAAAPERGARP
jgi:phosphoribosylformimino-5-aminoimidazole carboxamide ribotide isomerase